MNLPRLVKPISISLSPNVQKDDVFFALKLLIKTIGSLPAGQAGRGGIGGPACRSGRGEVVTSTERLEQKFKQYLGAKHAFSVNSGRSALYIIVKALDIKEDDQVLLQAFTCNAVPNPVLWAGGTAIYVDIDDSLNIEPRDLERKISNKSRAVIIQHTFGVPAQIDKILEIARRHNLIVIEDCAHALGATYNGQKVGTFGDIAFFSFGRDKVISSVWGGMIATSNDELAQKIITHPLAIPSKIWTIRQLLHPVLFAIIIPTYYIFGKYLLALLRIVRGVGLAVSKMERIGERPNMFPARMPEALAELALHQFEKLEKYNTHRREIANLYFRELTTSPLPDLPDRQAGRQAGPNPLSLPSLPAGQAGRGGIEGGEVVPIYLRFNMRHPRAKEIIQEAKRRHILLGDWYKNIIDPIGTDFEKMKYTPGSCPNAEKAARESINLPTHINISKKDAGRIIQCLRNYK